MDGLPSEIGSSIQSSALASFIGQLVRYRVTTSQTEVTVYARRLGTHVTLPVITAPSIP